MSSRTPYDDFDIAFAPRARNYYEKKMDHVTRECFANGLDHLVKSIRNSPDGHARIGRAKRLKGCEGIIWELDIGPTTDLRMLYGRIDASEDIVDSLPTLAILDFSDHDNLNRRAKASTTQLVHASKMDKLDWDNATEVIDLATIPEGEEGILSLRQFEREAKDTFNPELDDWSKESLNEFYDGAAIWELFWPKKESMNEFREGHFQAHLRLKEHQQKLLEYSQIFLLEGVAGTGKTTILERRFTNILDVAESSSNILFLTLNPELASEVRARIGPYVPVDFQTPLDELVMDIDAWMMMMLEKVAINDSIIQKKKAKEAADDANKELEILEEEATQIEDELEILKSVPKKPIKKKEKNEHLFALKEKNKAFISVKKKLRGQKKKVKKLSDALDEKTKSADSKQVKKSIDSKYNSKKKITYDDFALYLSKQRTMKYDASTLWEEYRGIIRGAQVDTNSSRLEFEEYEELGRKRGRYDASMRKEVYRDSTKLFNNFKDDSIKSPSRGGWVDQDLARDVMKIILNNSVEKYDAIFIDEVQDLTELQIRVILQALDNKGSKKFEAAGDLSQSVYPSAFRWEDLRKTIYEVLQISPGKEKRLDINYRATPKLVAAANWVLEEHSEVEGEKRRHIQRAAAEDSGELPSLLMLPDKIIIDKLKQLELPNPFCPLVVRDEGLVEDLSKKLSKHDSEENVHVMSIPSCKGLEYENVILWDPFSSSDGIMNRYYHHKKGALIKEKERPDQSLLLEFRHLFVGITRARYRLIIIEPGKGYKKPSSSTSPITSAFDHLARLDDLFDVRTIGELDNFSRRDISREDYVDRAREFERSGRWKLAADCWNSAHQSFERARCMAEYHEKNREHALAAEQFEEASDDPKISDKEKKKYWIRAKNATLSAIDDVSNEGGRELASRLARLSEYLGEEEEAARAKAEIYMMEAKEGGDSSRDMWLSLAASEYIKAGNHEKAAEIQTKLGNHDEAVRIYCKQRELKSMRESILRLLKSNESSSYSSDLFSGNDEWKEKVSELTGIAENELPIFDVDLDRAISLAKGKKKNILELQKAAQNDDWKQEWRLHEKLGNYDEAIKVLRKRGKVTDVLKLQVRNDLWDDINEDDLLEYLDAVIKEIDRVGRDPVPLIMRFAEQKIVKHKIGTNENIPNDYIEPYFILRAVTSRPAPSDTFRVLAKPDVVNLVKWLSNSLSSPRDDKENISRFTHIILCHYLLELTEVSKKKKWQIDLLNNTAIELKFLRLLSGKKEGLITAPNNLKGNDIEKALSFYALKHGEAETIKMWYDINQNFKKKPPTKTFYTCIRKIGFDCKPSSKDEHAYISYIGRIKKKLNINTNSWDLMMEEAFPKEPCLCSKCLKKFPEDLPYTMTQLCGNKTTDWSNFVDDWKGVVSNRIPKYMIAKKTWIKSDYVSIESEQNEVNPNPLSVDEDTKKSVTIETNTENEKLTQEEDVSLDTQVVVNPTEKESNIVEQSSSSSPPFPLSSAIELVDGTNDPYPLIQEIVEDWLCEFAKTDDERSSMSTLIAMEWTNEINNQWINGEGTDNERISLLAGSQFLIDLKKKNISPDVVTQDEKSLLHSRAGRNINLLGSIEWPWSQRPFMP